jgi:alpha-amylase/alpha-mannosidase (GH57 family)
MTQVALLWHMHQPSYEDLVTQEHILPWVRLHALKDYYGMVAMLEAFPTVRVTFNLVPSLLVQIEAFAENRARDRFLDLSLKPAAELTGAEVQFVLENFFHAQRERMIDVHPRYAELLALRGAALPVGPDLRNVADRFSEEDLRDLQVWHKLAWMDPIYMETDSRVRGLLAKGRGFTEEDKLRLRETELELLNRVIPEYRSAVARGQIEISTSPFYHPILPLLCDSNVYLHTHPNSPMPRRRFAHPEDAAEQLSRAAALHERLFGRLPVGVWPSEGSVSDAIVPLVAAAGFAWMATDEQILGRTLSIAFWRDGRGQIEHPESLYRAYQVSAGGAHVACVFRDHVMSDLIGFTYAGWPAEAAARDFVARLVEAGRRYASRTGGEEALISIILDGENAWEHFEGGGRPFLRALYGLLSEHPDLRTVTMAEACARPRRELTGIFPGSWIDANFYIWIGHADDQRAWSQLADARQALESASGVDGDRRSRAREEIMIAEGSDWFWWYGDDHSSAHDSEFDNLFRRHLRNAYELLGQPIPEELLVSNISSAARETAPTSLITPILDGEETSYFEWLGAGTIEPRTDQGTMHRGETKGGPMTLVHVGFDRECLYLRVDSDGPMAEWLTEGYEVAVTFLNPEGIRCVIRQREELSAVLYIRGAQGADDQWIERGPGRSRAGCGTVLEAALSLADLGLTAGAAVAFLVTMRDPRTPTSEPTSAPLHIELTVPDERFAGRNWTA